MAIKITENGKVRYVNENDVDRLLFPNLSCGISEEAKEEIYKLFVTETSTGAVASFTDGADSVPVKDLTVAIEPVQSGSGDPSPENVRTISGWTGANVTRTGKNLYDLSKQVVTTYNTYLVFTLVHNTDYVFSTDKIINGLYASYSDAEICPDTGGTWSSISSLYNITSLSFNSGTHKWYRLMTYEQAGVQERTYQLELGSTATAYEPYQGETYEVDWQTEAGTVYGGTLDVTTGVLTVDRAVITMDGTQSIVNNGALSYGGIQVVTTPSPAKKLGATNAEGLLSDKFKTADIAEPYTLVGRTSNANLVFNMPTDVTSIELAKTWFTNNPTQVSYLLATPQTYQLTPQEVSTLLGQNNIFADCGNVTVQYRADTKLYIDKVVNA